MNLYSLEYAYNSYMRGNYKEALNAYSYLGEAGSVEAQIFVAWMYESGNGVERSIEQAIRWYEMAAKSNSAQAQFSLGKIYARKENYIEAFNWYNKSAENKYSPGIYRLGYYYEIGRVVEKDFKKAISLYKTAADAGHIFALRNYGLLLLSGKLGFWNRFLGPYYFFLAGVGVLVYVIKNPEIEKLKD